MRDAERSRGQAVPEYTGLVVVLALLLAAAALVVARSDWAGRASPSRAAPGAWSTPVVDLATPAQRNRAGRFTRWRRVLTTATRVSLRGIVAAGRGFGGAARRDLEEFLRDPVGVMRGSGSALRRFLRDPVTSSRTVIADAREYWTRLRAMRGEDAFVRMMEDFGAAAEDVAVWRGRGLIRRRMLRTLRDRIDRGAPGDTPSAGPRG